MKHPLENELHIGKSPGVREEYGAFVVAVHLAREEGVHGLVRTEALPVVDADEADLVRLGVPLEVVDNEATRRTGRRDGSEHGSRFLSGLFWLTMTSAAALVTLLALRACS